MSGFQKTCYTKTCKADRLDSHYNNCRHTAAGYKSQKIHQKYPAEVPQEEDGQVATQYDKTILPELHPKTEGTEQDHRPCEDSLKYANFYEQGNQDTSVPLQPVCASADLSTTYL